MAALQVSDGIWKGGWRKVTATRAESSERGTMALVQEYAPPASGGTNYMDLIYSSPGGSSLPTPIFFVPFNRSGTN
jgi:hypothetical protein